MIRFGKIGCLFLLVTMVQAAESPPYEFQGLHVRQGFSEAISVAEALGAVCEVETLRRGELVNARCLFPACDEETQIGSCENPRRFRPTLGISAHPIVSIGLKADGASKRLSKITIVFEGSAEELFESLKQEFGEPFSDTTDHAENTWTHSRRIHWKSGRESLGLLKAINTITLIADPVRVRPEPDSN